MSISKFLLVFPCTDKAPHNNRLNNSLSLSPADGVCACARAYKLSASGYRGNKRVLSRGEHWSGGSSPARVSIDAVRFYQSCRPRPRRHQIILFIERKRSLNRRARYVVYLLLRLVVFLPLAAPTPLLFSTSTAFTTRSFLSLLFSCNRFSVAIFGVDKMPGRVSNRLARLEKRVRGWNGMGGEDVTE